MANYVNTCDKALREWAKAYGLIKGEAAKDKAYRALVAFSNEVMGAHALALMAKDGVTLEPEKDLGASVSDVPVIEGDTTPAETDHAPQPVETPLVANPDEPVEVLIYGWANNPRLMLGELEDGTKVSVWRAARSYRLPQKFMCRLDRNSGSGNPIYNLV